MQYIPVPTTARGLVDVPDREGLRIHLPDFSANVASFQPDGMTLTTGMVSSTTMTSLGFGGLTGNLKTYSTFYVLDFVATSHIAAPADSGPLLYAVVGAGLRIGIASAKVSGNASFSLGALAASATISSTATLFEAQTVAIGLTPGTLPFVQTLVDTAATQFNVDSLKSIGLAFSSLGEYFAQSGCPFPPVPIGVVIDEGAQLESCAASYGFALRSIEKKLTLAAALAKSVNSLPPGVQRLDPVVAATYASILGTADQNTAPQQAQCALASQLDQCGP